MKIFKYLAAAVVAIGISTGVVTTSIAAPPDYAARNLRVTADTKSTVDVAWNTQTSPVQWRLYRNGVFLSTAGSAARSARFGVNVNNSQYVLGVEAVLPDTSRQLSTITVKRWAAIGTTEPPVPVDDTTFPVVNITSPSDGATVSGTIPVTANASDNIGVVGVQFRVNGTNLETEDTTSPYSASFNTTTVSDGNHNLTAVARDAAGNITTSAVVTVNVDNVQDPPPPAEIKIGEEALGATVDSGNGNMILAQKHNLDRTATLTSMSFYVQTAAGELVLGLYDDNGPNGMPGTRLGTTTSFTPVTGWNTRPITQPIALAAGDYWLAYHPSSSSLSFRLFSGGEARWVNTAFGPLPATFPTTTGGDAVHWSFYATLNEGGTPPPPTPQCSDAIDNDGDGDVDLADDGCSSASDNDESDDPTPLPQCSNSIDDDGDGLVDMSDPGCANPSDNDETNTTPSGVSLQQIDGGTNYYSQFAGGAAWDNPNFFPIGVWGSYAHEDSNIAKDKAVGLNTYFWAADPNAGYLQNMREAGMFALVEGNPASLGTETVGRVLGDEQDMTQGPSACPSAITQADDALPQDGRFRYNNFGKGVLIWNTDQEAACWVNHPDLDVVSTDLYWLTDPNEDGRPQDDNPWGYGYNIERQRMLDRLDGIVKPQMTFVEVTNAMNGPNEPTPAEIRAAVWHALIAGARGVEYFQHDFAGTCVTHHALRETGSACYGAIINMVTSVNAQITSLARQLNSPFVNGGRTVTGAVNHMMKWDGSNFYVFVAARSATGMNFSMPCIGNGQAVVLGENRSIVVQNGTFTDNFADGNAVHIYRIDGGGTCGLTTTPPPSSDFPNASNTGPSGTLTSSTGSLEIITPGTVIENRLINGCVEVRANNVTIRNTHIRCNSVNAAYGIRYVEGHDGLLVEDSIVECVNGVAGSSGVATTGGITMRRSEVFGCENNVWIERDVLLEDNYIHSPIPYNPATDPHTDSIQMPTPSRNIVIRHNTVYGGYIDQSNFGNSAITTGTSESVLIENNLLAGGGYALRCPVPNFPVNQFQWHNNRFSRIFVNTVGGFGPMAGCDVFPNSGNVYHETGEPINPT